MRLNVRDERAPLQSSASPPRPYAPPDNILQEPRPHNLGMTFRDRDVLWRSGERPRQVLRLANARVPQSTRRRPSPTTTRTPALRPTHQVTLTSCTGSGHAPPTNRIHNASEEETVAVVHRRAVRAIHNQNATTPHPSAIPLLLQPAGTPTSIPSRTRGHSPDRLRRDPIPTPDRPPWTCRGLV